MEPLTLATIAATLVLTKALEKTGDKLGDEIIEQGAGLLELIKDRLPKLGSKIEGIQQKSLPGDFNEAYLDAEFTEIVAEVDKAASQDREIADEVASLGTKALSNSPQKIEQTIEKWTGINNKGEINTISGNTFNF